MNFSQIKCRRKKSSFRQWRPGRVAAPRLLREGALRPHSARSNRGATGRSRTRRFAHRVAAVGRNPEARTRFSAFRGAGFRTFPVRNDGGGGSELIRDLIRHTCREKHEQSCLADGSAPMIHDMSTLVYCGQKDAACFVVFGTKT